MNVVMLLYPRLTQLDLTGPFEVLSRFKELTVHLAWKDTAPVADGAGLRLLPTVAFADCPQADILFVPGGPGQLALMEDAEVLDFLRRQAAGARYVTSVCTGSLVLAAAGLLTGYRATCHWLSLDQLGYFGAVPVAERVVIDRNRVTGAGVTSGIDFALTLMAEIFGEARTKRVQLAMEYDPAPPFAGGSPRSAEAATVAGVEESTAAFQRQRQEVARKVAATLQP
ncbi:DJ-1/PfpI family protein [Oceanibaculum pacificum]|uniref:Thiamine biosynthesis protein ThiJ n=1 Tax=Oceanibaculum pacificum TaxID=580166 RepID=A0A154WGR0_9PROT|nr:DJ-1/PfpI family protein [Oceanibaculum pacificum]KZD12713.1 thiamine biosynthesis protein ThiJ [Oceanibaculum pacificum]